MKNVVAYAEKDNQFYPTPKSLLERIEIDFRSEIKAFHDAHIYDIRVLEPSAGKGDIAKHLKEYWGRDGFSVTPRCAVDCVEIDPNLRMVLKGSGFPLVHDDFLSFETYTKYDLIFMNPPFESADKHLLKAISMQERFGGKIICILNAETLRNPFTRSRAELSAKLQGYNASVKFYSDAFSAADSERKTDVEVAVVWVDVPAPESLYNSSVFEELDRAEQIAFEQVETEEQQALMNMGLDWVSAYVKDYNDQVKSAVAFLREYTAFVTEYDARFGSIEGEASKYNKAFSLEVRGEENGDINHFLTVTRRLYWKQLFAHPKFTGKLTNRLKDELSSRLDEMANIEFNEKNILLLMEENMKATVKGIEAEILSLFDEMTRYAQYDGCDNVHYYNGWKTNSAHKLNKKIIIPFYGVWKQDAKYKYHETGYGGYCTRDGYQYRLDSWEAIRKLTDLSKTLNYLAKGICGLEDMEHLRAVIERNFEAGNARNIETEHLILTFYKKGTCHLKFKNEDLLEKFNLFASQRKGWLPPSYGTKDYKKMTEEEKAVVDEFQGEEAYNKVMANKAAYFLDAPRLLMLE